MKIGFLGCGNMGGALAVSVRAACPAAEILLCDRNKERAAALAGELHANVCTSEELVRRSDYVFLGVKPQVLPGVLTAIFGLLPSPAPVFVSMAAGVPLATIEEKLGAVPLIRIMPNTPVSVGKGSILYTLTDPVTEEQEKDFLAMMRKAGELHKLPEQLIDAGCALSGCGPAYVFLFLEALADGGVACGLSRADARRLSAETVLGSAALALASDASPAELKDAVCSPAGSTIAGVAALESGAFRASVMQAVAEAYRRTRELGK